MALMGFLGILQRNAVGYECLHPRKGHCRCAVITFLPSGVRCVVDHHGFAQFVAGCTFYLPVAQFTYGRSVTLTDYPFVRVFVRFCIPH